MFVGIALRNEACSSCDLGSVSCYDSCAAEKSSRLPAVVEECRDVFRVIINAAVDRRRDRIAAALYNYAHCNNVVRLKKTQNMHRIAITDARQRKTITDESGYFHSADRSTPDGALDSCCSSLHVLLKWYKWHFTASPIFRPMTQCPRNRHHKSIPEISSDFWLSSLMQIWYGFTWHHILASMRTLLYSKPEKLACAWLK